MGICISCHSPSSLPGNLIFPDGTLLQFSTPISVSDVLRKHPSTFICNSDDMDFDDLLSPIKHDDHLHPGQLYFALPLKRLNHPLQPEEMAALAVKASGALARSGNRRRGRESVCSVSGWVRGASRVADVRTVGLCRKSGGGGGGGGVGGGGRGKGFRAKLSTIPE